MLKDINLPKSRTYRTGSDHEPFEFYLNCLFHSKQLDLLLGYFSSAAISVLSLGFAKFIYDGGKLRIVANQILSEEDRNAILLAREADIEPPLDLTDIKALKNNLDEYGKHFFKCLAYLISINRIEIKIVKTKTKGIPHYKSGIFKDEFNKVSFQASCNFTAYGLLENAESLNCFVSTDGASITHKIEEDEEYFEQIFEEKAHHLEYLDPTEVEIAIKSEFGTVEIEELLIEERDLLERKNEATSAKGKHIDLIEIYEQEIERVANEPRFPFPKERDIQKDAYSSWIGNNKQGIFAMATGSGKTVTALNCLLKQYQENGFYKAIIVVPTQALALQWEEEVKSFNFQDILSTHTDKNWKEILTRYSTRSIFNQKKNLILITTYATFNRKDIQSFIKKTKGIESFIYIADEAHNIGSPTTLKNIPEKIMYRIGLSATPERIYDDTGSKKLYDFFNSQPPHYTYRYTMKQAIDDEILCKYDYYPVFVELTTLELDEYKKITNKLRKFIDSKTGQYKKEAEMLLLQRKRIIHKAENKKQAISNLLDALEKDQKLNYTFVFVPEGFEPDYSENDSYEIRDEDMHIIDSYAEMFRTRNYKYYKFVGGLNDSQEVLESFEEGHIDVLLAMKCLDEGVDIPRTENAIFCSSTGNPRQFVQRRGRVLRSSDNKEKAKIWDLIVVPPNIYEDASSIERNMFMGEVKRIMNFAALAENQIDILYGELKNTCEHLNIDLFKMLEEENEQYN